MGTHGAAGTRARALPPGSNTGNTGNTTAKNTANNTVESTVVKSFLRQPLNLSDWPVARRLFTVIVAALLMGLVFGGLRGEINHHQPNSS